MGALRVGLGILAVAAMLLADGAPLEAQGRGRNKGFRVPPGHMPPPGQCRVWYQGVPPGRQPAPVPCRALRGHYFPGAVIVHSPVRHRYARGDFERFERVERFYAADRRFRDRRRYDRVNDARFRDVRSRDSGFYLDVWEPGPNGFVALRLAFGS